MFFVVLVVVFFFKSGQTVLGKVMGSCLGPADGDVQPECVLDDTSQESQVKLPTDKDMEQVLQETRIRYSRHYPLMAPTPNPIRVSKR